MTKYDMIAFVVLVVMVTGLIRWSLMLKYRDRRERQELTGNRGNEARLEAEVKQLKERLAVLERITVEKENSLEREIERLRDHP